MLVFFGTSHYSAIFLDKVIKNGLKAELVVSAPPKPVGRDQALVQNPTATVARQNNLLLATTLEELNDFSDKTIGLMLDFNQIIPQSIISQFEKGIVNIHFSKLPQYRGPAPVQYTILNGQAQAWISYYLIDAGVDKGPILAQTSVPLKKTETAAELYRALVEKAAQEAPLVIADYLNGKIAPRKQQGQESYTTKISTEEAKIDWQKSAEEIERLIRAASPEPGAWTEVELNPTDKEPLKKRLKILKAHLEGNQLAIDQVQLEGKNPVSYKQLKEGYPQAKFVS